jgi:DNA-binding transcriptional LysR family regulator
MDKPANYLDSQVEIDLRKLRYFLAVAEHLNFGRAAHELLMAQPALSRAVKALEDDLGVRLFDRDRQGVALTAAGSALLVEAGPLLAQSAAVRRRVRAAGLPSVAVSIGFRPGIIITEVVQRFTREHPGIGVTAQRIEWDEQNAAVLDGRVDVAWIRTPVEQGGLDLLPLFDDPEVLAVPRSHRLAASPTVTLADLAEEPVLRYDAAPAHAAGRAAEHAGVRTMEEKLEAVALGYGLALVPATAASYYQRPDIAYLPVTDAPAYKVTLATASGRRLRPEVAAFLEVATAFHRVG